jgi:hypothetical protein
MNRSVLTLASFATFALALSACGGGSGSGPSGITTPPTTLPTTAPGRSSTSVAFRVPVPPDGSTPSFASRFPRYISPGTDKFTLIIDGIKAFDAISIFNTGPTQNYTSADGNTKVALTNTIGGGYFNFAASIDTLPGTHTLGVVLISGTPAIVMSEGQATYALSPGPNTAATLALRGPLGSGYIECASQADIAANNGCANSFNTTTGLYTLTAVGADYNGFPIAYQVVNANPLSFDNGSFSVVETSGNVVTLSNNGPFGQPGNQFNNTAPSGSWYVDGTYTYGQPFNVKCNKLGTATLALVTTQTGPTNPVTGFNYVYFPPTSPPGYNYPGAQTLPTGSKTHTGTHNNVIDHNAVTNLATVNCDANLALTLI